MQKLIVNEYFYSLQGEGIRAGKPSIFIRLSKCDLSCGFCDTEFESGKEITVEELYGLIKSFPCKEIVWTGGEPSLQLKEEHIKYFKGLGYYQCIETNGNNRIPPIDHITLSPKVAEHILERNFPNEITEIKYVRNKSQLAVPNTKVKAKYYFISPQFDGDQPNIENIKHCINLILENPKWQLTMQNHKLLKIQ